MSLSAGFILSIPVTEPERLFSGPSDAPAEYRAMMKAWHPDSCPDPQAAAVSAHIIALYRAAKPKFDGTWIGPRTVTMHCPDGKLRHISYRQRHRFELGEMLYGNVTVTFLVRNEFADLFDNARKVTTGYRYRDAAMEKEVARYLPKIRSTFETKDGYCVMVLEKTPDVFLLRDVINAVGGKLDPKHVAWVQNTLHNLSCYLAFSDITHNDISPDTYFISPEYHSGCLYGGWWYAKRLASKLEALPARSMRFAPHHIRAEKLADPRLDQILIRITGREQLGDITGTSLKGQAPDPMVNFLRGAVTRSAVEDYRTWSKEVLPASFGARRFVKLVIPQNAI